MDDTYSTDRPTNQTSGEDYRQYDRIWQRVAPDLNPYPEVRMENGDENFENLPGAQADPCCMGSAAKDFLAVIGGFIEDEQAGRDLMIRFARCAPNPGSARTLRQIAARKEERMKHLAAAYYLTTGNCYTRNLQIPAPASGGGYCTMLREAYHEEACTALNYLRAADGTTDPCLQRMLRRMGEASYQDAEQLLHLLSRHIR